MHIEIPKLATGTHGSRSRPVTTQHAMKPSGGAGCAVHGCIAAPAGSLAAKVVQDTIDGVLPPVVRRFRGRTVALEASKQLVALDVPIHSPQVAELLRL